jgi:hypothetical protein
MEMVALETLGRRHRTSKTINQKSFFVHQQSIKKTFWKIGKPTKTFHQGNA